MRIWEYLQTQDDKTVVIICPDRNEAEATRIEVWEEVQKHTLLNRREETMFTSTTIHYGTNLVICTSPIMALLATRARTIDVLLFSVRITEDITKAVWSQLAQNLAQGSAGPDAIVAKYRRNSNNGN
jgi:hypothetical protein